MMAFIFAAVIHPRNAFDGFKTFWMGLFSIILIKARLGPKVPLSI
jgi:hypothetical protein